MSTSKISVGKAKPALCEIVEQAGAGRTRIITVHGKPIAQIGPVPTQTSNAKKLTAAWRKRVKHIRLNRPGQAKVSLHGLIAESRKRTSSWMPAPRWPWRGVDAGVTGQRQRLTTTASRRAFR